MALNILYQNVRELRTKLNEFNTLSATSYLLTIPKKLLFFKLIKDSYIGANV